MNGRCLIGMRRITLKILVASLTFIIGVGLASAWLEIRHDPLSLCSISANPTNYDGKLVRVRGDLYVSRSGVIQLNGIECGLRSNAWADVSFGTNPKLIEELRRLSDGNTFGKAEVVLTGKFTDRKRSCFAAQFEISEANIERASQVSIANFLEEIEKENARLD